MSAESAFSNFDRDTVDRLASRRGFRRKGPRTWSRQTDDFVQVVNLQLSQWSKDTTYLNFALWPLVFGQPRSLAESKFHFRTRAEAMSAENLEGIFDEADRLTTLAGLAEALKAKRVSGLVTRDLSHLLGKAQSQV